MIKRIRDEIARDHGVTLVLFGLLFLTATVFVALIDRIRGDF